MTSAPEGEAVLEGVTILDFSQTLPGPYATQLLIDQGAEVVKIERPSSGDVLRTMIPGMFAAHNRGKRSLTLNLREERGSEIALRLAARSDVVIEGFRPGVMERLGLSYEELRQGSPGLVYCSISGYGTTGPLRQAPGHDLNYMAHAGWLGANRAGGPAAEDPDVPVTDLAAGLFAAHGIVLALIRRWRTGEGSYLDVSLTDVAATWALTRMGSYILDGRTPEFDQRDHPGHGVYECADGRRITIGAMEDHFWERMCRALGIEERSALPIGERSRRAEELREQIAARVRTESAPEWVERLEAVDVPVAVVLDVTDVDSSELFRARNLFFRDEGIGGDGEILQARDPVAVDPARPVRYV